MMLSEAHESPKFGQLDAADLAGYEDAVRRAAWSNHGRHRACPRITVGVLPTSPASADALRAAEASLTARAEARQQQFGRSWEDVARLMVAVRDGVDPLNVDVRVKWSDASTRSVAQEADAVTKLFAAGLLPASYALQRLGLYRRRNRGDSNRAPHRGVGQRRRRHHKAGVMTYQDQLIALADSSDTQVQVVYRRYLAGDLSAQEAIALMAAAIAQANSRVFALADLALAATIMVGTGEPAIVTGVPPAQMTLEGC